jgi:hypothetical protein
VSSRSSALALAAVVVLLLGLVAGSGAVWGAFSAPTTNAGNELRAVPDFVAPAVGASVIQKSAGGTPGFIRSGGGYRVYAAVTDSGRPASGTASVTASLSPASLGLTNAPLTAGSYAAVAGTTYSHRGALQTLPATAAATYPLTLGTADVAGNARTQAGSSVVVDNTAPVPTGVRTANRTGGIAGRPEAGDTLTLTYSEPIDAISLVAGWEGTAATNVVVRLTNGSTFGGTNDSVTIQNATNTATLPLGTIDLGRRDYTSSARTFGASGTPSTLTMAGSEVTVTLGTASGTTTTTAFAGSLRWTPGSGSTDRAGNPIASSSLVETGAADKDF